MAATEELLKKVLETLDYHGKLLETLVETIDAKKHDHRASMLEAQKKINDLAAKMGDSPLTDVILESAKALMGGKHGS